MIIVLPEDQKQVAYYSEELPFVLLEELILRSAAVRFPKIDPIVQFLDSLDIKTEVGHYKTYIFPDPYTNLASKYAREYHHADPLVQAFEFGGFAEKIYAVERDGKIISACVSTRENQCCGEAWVYTDPEYRRQGFAQNVVGAWARSLLLVNRVPFYSHRIENVISAKLAKCLQLQPVFEEITISYKNV